MTEVLRKAYLAAAKLEQSPFVSWLKKETDGYGESDDIPKYRESRGIPVFWNPFRGELPLMIPRADEINRLCLIKIRQPLPEVISLIDRAKKDHGGLEYDMPAELQHLAWSKTPSPMKCYLRIEPSHLDRLVEAVRHRILEWSIQLEKAGIRGEGMSFTSEEVQNAKSITIYNINNSQGIVAGNVQGQTVEIRGYSSIHSELEKAGVSKEARLELEDLMEAHAKASPEEKPSVAKKGMNWIVQNADKLAALSSLIRGWFQ